MKRKTQNRNATTSNYSASLSQIIEEDDIAAFQKLTRGKNIDAVIKDSGIEFPAHLAAQNGSVEILKNLINKNKFFLIDTDDKGFTPLHSAAFAGQNEALTTMFKLSPNMYTEDKGENGATALYLAVSKNHLRAAEVLIKHGADVETYNKMEGSLKPLGVAAKNGNLDMAQLLLSNGANIESKDSNGLTPLCIAAREGEIEMAQYLLSKGADINYKAFIFKSPLFYAAMQGHDNIVKLFLKSFNPTKLEVLYAISPAIENGHIEVFKTLLGIYKDHDKSILLYKAVESRCEDIVTLLLRENINVNIACNKGETSLHIAARNNDLSIAQKLIKYGAKLDICDFEGLTPLHKAVQKGHVNFTALLLENKADIMMQTPNTYAFPNFTAYELALKLGNDAMIQIFNNFYKIEQEAGNDTLGSDSLRHHDNYLDDGSKLPYLGLDNQILFDEYKVKSI